MLCKGSIQIILFELLQFIIVDIFQPNFVVELIQKFDIFGIMNIFSSAAHL